MTFENEQIHNLVSKVLGQFTVIAIGQERTAFRDALAEEIAAHDAKVRGKALREAADAEDLPYLTIHPSGSPILALPYAARGESVELADWLRARADKEENR